MLAFGVAATTMPAGRLSVTSRLVAGTKAVVLLMVNVMPTDPFKVTLGDAKALVKVGTGAADRVKVADDVPLSPIEDVDVDEVLVWLVADVDWTVTETVQLAPAATVPPE